MRHTEVGRSATPPIDRHRVAVGGDVLDRGELRARQRGPRSRSTGRAATATSTPPEVTAITTRPSPQKAYRRPPATQRGSPTSSPIAPAAGHRGRRIVTDAGLGNPVLGRDAAGATSRPRRRTTTGDRRATTPGRQTDTGRSSPSAAPAVATAGHAAPVRHACGRGVAARAGPPTARPRPTACRGGPSAARRRTCRRATPTVRRRSRHHRARPGRPAPTGVWSATAHRDQLVARLDVAPRRGSSAWDSRSTTSQSPAATGSPRRSATRAGQAAPR